MAEDDKNQNTQFYNINDLPIDQHSSVDDIFNVAKTLTKQLEVVNYQKTHIHASEFFDEYYKLFNNEQLNQLSQDDGYDLAAKWEQRVNKFQPVHVIDDETQKELFTLPSIYNYFSPLNECKGTAKDLNTGKEVHPTTLPEAFSNILTRSDDNRKKSIVTNDLVMASRLAQQGKLEQQVEENQQIIQDFIKKKEEAARIIANQSQSDNSTSGSAITTNEVTTDNIEWE
jgi:predicted YcjX-like family ATPase